MLTSDGFNGRFELNKIDEDTGLPLLEELCESLTELIQSVLLKGNNFSTNENKVAHLRSISTTSLKQFDEGNQSPAVKVKRSLDLTFDSSAPSVAPSIAPSSFPDLILNSNQIRSIIIILRCSGALSVIGSMSMIYDIIKSGNLRSQCRLRLLSGMSIFDILSSSAFFCASWPTPQTVVSKRYDLEAFGSVNICQAQGFFLTLLIGSLCYSLSLTVYYVLVVKYGKSEEWLKEKVEPWMHAFSIGYGTIVPLILLPFGFDAYRNYYSVCRPKDNRYATWLAYYFSALIILLISCLNFSLYKAVRKIERKVARFSSASSSTRQRVSQSRQIALQCFAFSASFYITYLPELIYSIINISRDQNENQYKLFLIVAICSPLQGFLNAFVYFRPRIFKK